MGASNVIDGMRATDSLRVWKKPLPIAHDSITTI